MREPSIPQRIPPLAWRGPSFLWTPIALALAIGWPLVLFYDEPQLQRLSVIAGGIVFALALITLGASWALGRAPRTRRTVVLHVLAATAIAAIVAPFVLTHVLALMAPSETQPLQSLSLAVTPLALVIGLPMALVSGLLFALVALERRKSDGELAEDGVLRPHDVQPFR